MPSKEYPKELSVKLSRYVLDNLETIKRKKNMSTEQALRYLINKECGENIYGSPLEKGSK